MKAGQKAEGSRQKTSSRSRLSREQRPRLEPGLTESTLKLKQLDELFIFLLLLLLILTVMLAP
jgi:uncharacterized protein YbaP (TraB family)